MLDFIKKFIPRTWSIWMIAIVAFFFLLPVIDVRLVFRSVTLFFIFCGCGWLALRVFWPERTQSLEEGGTRNDELRSLARDICYAVVVSAAIVGAASLSL